MSAAPSVARDRAVEPGFGPVGLVRHAARSPFFQATRFAPIPAPQPRVFAAEDTSLQVDWHALTPGHVEVRCGDSVAASDADGGPGVVVLEGLPANSPAEVTISCADHGAVPETHVLPGRTLATPPGEELCRVATISDLHLGENDFGYLHTMYETDVPLVPYTLRCTEAAIAESAEWGAQLLVVKGDVTNRGLPGQWATAARLFGAAKHETLVVPGNHDVKNSAMDLADALPPSLMPGVRGLTVRDLPGVRVLIVDSTVADRHEGRVKHLQADVADAVADARHDDRAALVAMHHHPQRAPGRFLWPPGIGRTEATGFLDALGRASDRVVVTSGHTHRNRRHERGPVTFTTVGSVKDYPGVWAGYVVHEGGLRQVVRRTMQPDVVRWTERSGDALAGGYRWWSGGSLPNRCFTLVWR